VEEAEGSEDDGFDDFDEPTQPTTILSPAKVE
jgi:hypothetical protein